MSYTKEQKQKAMQEQNKMINDLGSLSVIDMEKERRREMLWFYVWLIGVGALITGICFFVHGI
jgi:hypothetical protein